MSSPLQAHVGVDGSEEVTGSVAVDVERVELRGGHTVVRLTVDLWALDVSLDLSLDDADALADALRREVEK